MTVRDKEGALRSEIAVLSARLASALNIMNNFSDSLVCYDSQNETGVHASLDASGIVELLLPAHSEGPAGTVPALPSSLFALPPDGPVVKMCRSREDSTSSRAAQSALGKARARADAELFKKAEAHDAKSEKEKRRLQAAGDRSRAELVKVQALRAGKRCACRCRCNCARM